MSKGDYVGSEIYGPHLNGGRFSNNPAYNEQIQYQLMYERMLTELAANRFKWENLPDEIDERFLELTLFRSALAVFFHSSSLPGDVDNYNKYFALRGSPAGQLDMYDNAVSFMVNGNSMLNATLDTKNCVPIWANYLRVPDHDIVRTFSRRLAEFDQSISIASMNMRNTNFVATTENQKLSITNMIRQRDAGQPVIYTSKGIDPMEAIQVIDMKVHPDTLPKLMIAKAKLWNECMTLLGINNANQDKRERLVSDEVSANDEQIDAVRQIALNARQQACDKINKMYRLKLSVDFHSTETEETEMLGGGANGNVHNGTTQSSGNDGE